ncbi:MAG: anaerobic sulfatase maturase [Lentisphaerae bacterium]|nr:anaerobic sulfatase maturase [Lentisphaerota bacterium]
MKPFSLLIKPASADCNLRCTYCFYLDHKALYPETRTHRMSDAVLEQMIASFMRTPQSQYAFGWQGGEPTLMGLEFFQRITGLQQKYGRSGAVVSNGLQTNGLLIDEPFARHLARYNFLIGLSVDGPAEIHNHYRRYADGRGSHAGVMKTLGILKKHHVEHNVLTLVNNLNVQRPREIYHYLLDLGVLFHQYIECVEFDERGNLQPFAVTGEAWGDFLCTIFDEWYKHDTRRVSIRLFDSILAMMVDGVPNVCAMGTDCRQYFVVEYNGDVYPCDFFVRPELKLGNVMTGTWDAFLASPVYREFGARKHRWNARCASCKFLRYCAGDCPKNRPTQGADPARLSVLCPGWLQFYKHTFSRFGQLADQIRAERQRQALPAGAPAAPPRRRIGRNDPCPCGSGKKYKFCCGAAGARHAARPRGA